MQRHPAVLASVVPLTATLTAVLVFLLETYNLKRRLPPSFRESQVLFSMRLVSSTHNWLYRLPSER